MKFYLKFLIFMGTKVLLAQTAGINYQALLVDVDEIEIPGNNISKGQVPLAVEVVNFRFTITGGPNTNLYYYVEEQVATTDENGLVSLVIGDGIPVFSSFDSIVWDGTPKYLNVEIDIVKQGNGYVELDSQKILYLPQYTENQSIEVSNGLSLNENTVGLGGVLSAPTTLYTSEENTFSLEGLQIGDLGEDQLVVIDRNTGVLRHVDAPALVKEEQKVIIASEGQTQFASPLPIEDSQKVNVYRNGIRIEFTVLDDSTIELESGVVCYQNDKIKIVQFY